MLFSVDVVIVVVLYIRRVPLSMLLSLDVVIVVLMLLWLMLL